MKVPVRDEFGSIIGYIIAPLGGFGCLECLVVGIFMTQDPSTALLVGIWVAIAVLPFLAIGLFITSLLQGSWGAFIASLICGLLWILSLIGFYVYIFNTT